MSIFLLNFPKVAHMDIKMQQLPSAFEWFCKNVFFYFPASCGLLNDLLGKKGIMLTKKYDTLLDLLFTHNIIDFANNC